MKSITACFLILLFVCLSANPTSYQIAKLNLQPQEIPTLRLNQLIQRFVDIQGANAKVVDHFIKELSWREINQQSKKQEFLNLIQDHNGELSERVKTFMEKKLFKKLEMEELTKSFKDEIWGAPHEYFLTFEMYDLLIDEKTN